MEDFTKDFNLWTVVDKFYSNEQCFNFLANIRWGQNRPKHCIKCGSKRISITSKWNRRWKCNSCTNKFNVLKGTLLEDGNLPLRQIFLAILLHMASSKGVCAKYLSELNGTTHDTSWKVGKMLRKAMINLNNLEILEGGEFEMDEAYCGGDKCRKKVYEHGKVIAYRTLKRGKGTFKEMIVGILLRGEKKGSNKVKFFHIKGEMTEEGINRKYTMKVVKHLVDIATKFNFSPTFFTDESPSYNGVSKIAEHKTVNHGQWQFVDVGNNHINGIEGSWKIIKDSLRADFNQVKPQNLGYYLAEFEFKFNNRNSSLYEKFEKVVRGICMGEPKVLGNVIDSSLF